jgi:hypothetical protein
MSEAIFTLQLCELNLRGMVVGVAVGLMSAQVVTCAAAAAAAEDAADVSSLIWR